MHFTGLRSCSTADAAAALAHEPVRSWRHFTPFLLRDSSRRSAPAASSRTARSTRFQYSATEVAQDACKFLSSCVVVDRANMFLDRLAGAFGVLFRRGAKLKWLSGHGSKRVPLPRKLLQLLIRNKIENNWPVTDYRRYSFILNRKQ